ncbi:uncharacterized protein LOC142989128 [Genypterus blacodes]|uniref:uncharacterized protein LOC142989128 n=1 Tax=Genypterus blacodes TaxID=154954 RepID=UPI003F770CD2
MKVPLIFPREGWKCKLFPHEGTVSGRADLVGGRPLREAFSDTEDFLDHGLVSANRCTSRTSSVSSWTENIKPSFTKKLKFQSVLEGDPVVLKCKLVACPPPTILWFHNNRPIPKERRRKIMTESKMHIHTTSLVFDCIKEKDSGSYKVMALNSEGSAESTASLLVSLREEQSANFLSFVRRSARAHDRIDTMVDQRKERKIRVDLRCVGSPFDKISKVHQGRSRSKTAVVRTVYFQSALQSKEKETEKESKHLETASECARSPPPMFERSERFNDRFSDIYCDRRTGGRYSDKFSDRCSDRYSERFSDTESLHNEVRTKLTSLQKAVRQKKRLSISTMSSSEFEAESVASESSYAEYIDRLRVKPASLPDVQHFNRSFDLGEGHGEIQGKTSSAGEPSHPHARHSFEPQSRTRAIQIMRGELVDTVVQPVGIKSDVQVAEDKNDETSAELQADVKPGLVLNQHHRELTERKNKALNLKTEPGQAGTLEYTESSVSFVSVQEEVTDSTGYAKVKSKERYMSETITPEDSLKATAEPYEEEVAEESLKVQYGKSLDTERMQCEEKLLALRIRKWQQGVQKSEEETFHPETEVPVPADVQYMEPEDHNHTQQELVEKRTAGESESLLTSSHKSPRIKPRMVESDEAIFSQLKSPKTAAKAQVQASTSITKSPIVKASAEVETGGLQGMIARAEVRLQQPSRPGPVRTAEESVAVTQEDGDTAKPPEKEASLKVQYQKSLDAERMQCEEKLLALRVMKWQQDVQMSDEEMFHPETDLPTPVEAQCTEPEDHMSTQKELVENLPSSSNPRRVDSTLVDVEPTNLPTPPPKSPKARVREEAETTKPLHMKSPRMRARAGDVEPETSVTLIQKSPQLKAKAAEETVAESSSVTLNTEEQQEIFSTGLQIPQKSKTLQLQPESKHFSSTLEKKKEKPVFLSQLAPAAVVTPGEAAQFTVTVSGLPKPTVQWFHNGNLIKSSSVYKLVEEREKFTLIITQPSSEYGGEYSCTASNRFGQTTCTTFLEVKKRDVSQAERWVEKMFKVTGQPPTFTVQIQPVRCSEGGEVSFKYKVAADPMPEVKWFKRALQIQPSKNCIIVAKPDGSGFVNFNSVKQEDSGIYTCKASNQFGEASCSAELVVFRESVSVSRQQEPLTVVQKKAYKVSVTEQATESRLYQVSLPGQDRAQSDQMVYTIGTEDRQIIPSEQVSSLQEFDISAATIHKERLTQQAAVLQAHETEERVLVVPTHPPQVSAVPAKQLHTAAFTSSVAHSQDFTEQHCDRIQSPEVIELQTSLEKRSKVMSAVAEELTPLSTTSTECPRAGKSTNVQPTSEPKHLVSGHQVESNLSILKEHSDQIPKPPEERGYKVKEGIKILYSAQSAENQVLAEGHTAEVTTADSAVKSSVSKEQHRPVLVLVNESKQTLSKESMFSIQRPHKETAQLCKDEVTKVALTADEKLMVQAECTQQLCGLDGSVSVQSQVEGEQLLHLQVITDQDLLPSAERFTCEEPESEQAGSSKSPTLLHAISQDEQRTVVCEDTSEFQAKASPVSLQPQTEDPTVLHIQSTQPVEALPKEGILVIEKPDQQVAVQKQERARKHAASSEEKREIAADLHSDLNVSVTGVQSQLGIEPRPQSVLQLTSQPMQLPKEKPFMSDMKQQRALVQKEERWNIMHVTSVSDSQALEEGHTKSLEAVEKSTCQTAWEPKVPTEPIQIEEKEISTESSHILEAAEQDFAVQIQEGQSVRQSIVMDEKRVLTGEISQEISKSQSSKVLITTQPKLSLLASESEDSTALPKEMTFVIQVPKSTSLNIRRQLRDALQSAVASDQQILLADIVGSLEAVAPQEVKVQRQPKRAIFSYLITTTGAPIEVTLAFEGEYPQTADLRSEIQAALHSMVSQEANVLTSEQPGTMQLDKPQRTQVSSAHSKQVLSTVVETVSIAESAVDFTAIKCQAAALKTESAMAVQHAAAERQLVVQESRTAKMEESTATQMVTISTEARVESLKISRQEVRSVTVKSHERDVGASVFTTDLPPAAAPTRQEMDVRIHREHREEVFKEEVIDSRPEVSEHPVIITSLEDSSVAEDGKATFSTTIKYVTKVNWFFNGQLVKSGKELECSKDQDTYTLTINKVVKEKHQGEFVCEAENEAGRTTTSSRLTVVSRASSAMNSLFLVIIGLNPWPTV